MQRFFYLFGLIVLFLISCDNNKTTIATSSENRVSNFTFYKDTANIGLTEAIYKIEHLSDTGLIYCTDSLRYGTRLDSVVPHVTYKATPASATFFTPDTSIVSTGADTLDFSKDPIYLMVQSSDLAHKRWYRIKLHVHQADPDLFVWQRMTPSIFAPQHCDMKAFFDGEKIQLFVNNGFSTQLYQSVHGDEWEQVTSPTGLPTPCQVRDILQHGDTLYYMANDKLYTSTNYTDWVATDYSDQPYSLINMLVVFDGVTWCILQDRETESLFLGVIHNGVITSSPAIIGLDNNVLPKNFPISDFAALSFQSSSERPRAMIVGGRSIDGTAINTRWNMEYELSAGYRMVDFSIEQPNFQSLTGISIIQYNQQLIMFGGIDNDLTYRSDILYSNDEGMHWYAPDTLHNQLPDTYVSRHKQSVVTDDQCNIYIIGGQNNTETFSDVYRGFLNKLKWQSAHE